jgi:hypothetical protein
MGKITYEAAHLVPQEEMVVNLYQHLVGCHNHGAHKSNKWQTPLEAVDWETPDIFRFYFYEPIWFLHGPSQLATRKWVKGRFLGIQAIKCVIG